MGRVAERCARCGRPVEEGEHLCARCREEEPVRVVGTGPAPKAETELDERRRRWPPGMVRPSPVQYHATVMVTVAAVLIGLAVFAFINHRSVGPFRPSDLHTQKAGPTALVATFHVTNQGSRDGRSTCRITAEAQDDTPIGSETVLTRPIGGGETVSVHHTLTQLPGLPDHLKIDCM